VGYDGTDWREVEQEFYREFLERHPSKPYIDPDPEATKREADETKRYASALRKRLKDPDERIFICERLLRHKKMMTDKEREFVEEMSSHDLPPEWPTAAQRGWLLYLCCEVRRRLGAELAEITFAPKAKARKRTLTRSV
jgi:hypothetical protein